MAARALERPRGLLTSRAVVALTQLAGVLADLDRRPAFVAGQASPLLDRPELAAVEDKARAPWPAVAISPQKLARCSYDPTQLVVVEVGDLRPWPGTRQVQSLVLYLVADAGEGPLIEEGSRDVAVRLRAQAAKPLVHVEVVRDHIGPELGNDWMERDLARRHELDHRRRLTRGDVLVRADHDSRLRRREPPALSGTVHMPLPLHAHVGVKHDILAVGSERDHEVLAVRLDRLHGAPYDLAAGGGGRHPCGNEVEPGDDAPGERATQHRRRAKDRVALGHGSR